MILADKIMDLRKKNGWSQEELANQLGVSRQAVSKWESAVSTPDLDKILKLSALFEVSTDYLLKDSIEFQEHNEDLNKSVQSSFTDNVRMVSMETAHDYLKLIKSASYQIALGVSLCILSPALLVVLTGVPNANISYPFGSYADGIGTILLLVMVAIAVSIFIMNGRKLSAYEFLEHQNIELAYGVNGLIMKEKASYEEIYSRKLILGIVLCILSAIPLVITNLSNTGETIMCLGVDFCLILVAAGVFFIVSASIVYGSFQKLLKEGRYTNDKKTHTDKNPVFRDIYWCTILALYLGWSFLTMNWERSWIIWPVAAVLYKAARAIISAIKHNP